MPTSRGRLEFRSTDFVAALAALSAAQKHGRVVSLSFNQGELELVRGATSVRLSAHGTWPTTATVGTKFVKDLLRRRKALPELLVLSGSDSHVHFSHYAVPCAWLGVERP